MYHLFCYMFTILVWLYPSGALYPNPKVPLIILRGFWPFAVPVNVNQHDFLVELQNQHSLFWIMKGYWPVIYNYPAFQFKKHVPVLKIFNSKQTVSVKLIDPSDIGQQLFFMQLITRSALINIYKSWSNACQVVWYYSPFQGHGCRYSRSD